MVVCKLERLLNVLPDYNSHYRAMILYCFLSPARVFGRCLAFAAVVMGAGAQTPVAVLTYHNDNSRQGVNTNETTLTLANVITANFGRIFSCTVDGYVYAQPLVMTNVTIPGKGVHNVVYVVTEHDSVYAFDADNNAGTNASPLWQTSFLNPAAGVTTVTQGDVGTSDIVPEIGISATPVIDPATGTLYLEAKTKEVTGGVTKFVHRLHALDLATGAERVSGTVANSPVIINVTNYPGTGTPGYSDNDGAGHVVFNALREHTRVALTLLNGVVYLGYASHGDNQPYHGWLLAYDAHTLAQLSAFNTTPNGGLGGFWQGGGGATVDAAGYLYYETGNGSFDATGSTFNQTNNSFAMCVLKFSATNGILKLEDYFAPHDAVTLSGQDTDLGSGASIILPDSAGSVAHPHLVVAAGKDQRLYLIDRGTNNMGRFNSANDSQIVQELQGALGGGSFMTPAFFNNTLYYIGWGDTLRAFTMSGGLISATPKQSPENYGDRGGSSPSISANGTSNAILWAIQADGYSSSSPAILRAYNATNVTQELYNSSQNGSRDNPGGAVKFSVPTVANGKVYVGAEYALSVFGLGAFLPTPVISPNGAVFTKSITVTLSNATAGTSLYYTLDGTAPTTNSIPYTAPFVLTNNAGVQAIAVKAGFVNSAIASAGFVNSSSVGSGSGLLGSYWTTTTSAAFGAANFNNAPTLVRFDPTVNFNWGGGSPDSSISSDTFTARWTGMVQPQYSQTYTFYTTTDDGVRLWVNGQLLIDKWIDQSPTTWSGTIALKAQQRYNIRMDYYENGGGAVASLAWSSPSTPQAIIPQNQIYPFTNPPPGIVLISPATNASYTASASVTLNAMAASQYNAIDNVAFYANSLLLGSISNNPYILTATGLTNGSYALTAVATDGSGLRGTSAPVNITVTVGSGLPYGLTNRPTVPAFFNMPQTINGTLPPLLSQAGVFADTPNLIPATGLIPYAPNTPLWSDNAAKTRWLALPYNGGLHTTDQQINFSTNGEWAFPTGTIFVKHFALATDESNPNAPLRRLETRLLVRDLNGAVYGVTYKWRPDNSEADLLTGSLSENIRVTNATGVRTQVWYYPSSSDCLVCHTPAANYVLGLKTRQLNGNFTYPSNSVTDNQLRVFNRLGLFNPGIDEGQIPGYAQMVSVTNLTASLTNRFRSYIDANCAQCHRPGGTGPSFDARYDTPLASQNIINGFVIGSMGYDNAHVVTPRDIWRSILYQRASSLDSLVKMPPLARNLLDSNAMAVVAAWINGLPGTFALAPPTLNPAGGTFNGQVSISVLPPDTNTTIYYTLDGSLPTTSSFAYAGPIMLTNSVTVNANAFEAGFNNSVAASGVFTILPSIFFTASAFSNGVFQLQLSATPNQTYVLQASTNLTKWFSVSTNTPSATPFYLTDPDATNFSSRFYRVLQQP